MQTLLITKFEKEQNRTVIFGKNLCLLYMHIHVSDSHRLIV